ncbi:MAG: phospho-sugar mutase [Bacteroidales bacterium]|jgi:phosphoglucomutase|nr:phospho-sugar mutase [Bacteroidales bacterium]
MNSEIKNRIDSWLNGSYDEQTKDEIRQLMAENPSLLEDAFYRNLEFGTGGLRGIMGVGTNRMNQYTVAMATQGLANYINQTFNSDKKVAVAFDSRNNSSYFAKVATNVLSANGIYVFLFDELRPTPELSFAIRHLECQAGIVITASHNPKEYNGYKVYWSDGGQIVPPHDKNIITQINAIKDIQAVKSIANKQMIQKIGHEIDSVYIEKIKTLSQNPEVIENYGNMSIVYTPLHGAGVHVVPSALEEFGFNNVTVLPQQAVIDGNFPTVQSPNPEESAALSMAIEHAQQIGAELVLATDPDCDRVGVAVRDKSGNFVLLNGNQTAALMVYYMCLNWHLNGKVNGNQYIVKTIVTTDLLTKIADSFDIETVEVLTGFKYIAEKMHQLENQKEFICGGEESYGYLVGDFVRDKDAVIACCIIAEILAYAKIQKKSLIDLLSDIYLKYGFYKEKLLSITRKGKEGLSAIAKMMENYRKNPPSTINHKKIVRIKDYLLQNDNDLISNRITKINLPVSDVLQFYLEDNTKITVRPSGTEPKIKFYFSVQRPVHKKEDILKAENNAQKQFINIAKECEINNL